MPAGAVDPRIAVVMMTRNRVQELLRSLKKLATLPERPRIVVIDNGSDDGTPHAVADRFPHVEVIEAGTNLGAAARTLGARHVDAPYVAFCDDDMWWEPGCLSRVADHFEARPRAGGDHGPDPRGARGPGRPDLRCDGA